MGPQAWLREDGETRLKESAHGRTWFRPLKRQLAGQAGTGAQASDCGKGRASISFRVSAAAGLSGDLFGTRLFPIGTLYDPFIARGLDQLNYACYQDARFMVVATPSGITLAGEGGAHQSIAEPLIGMTQDGLAAFEPAYVDELAVIMRWAFDYMQKSGTEVSERNWLRDETGGSVYLRLSTRPVEQPQRRPLRGRLVVGRPRAVG